MINDAAGDFLEALYYDDGDEQTSSRPIDDAEAAFACPYVRHCGGLVQDAH